MAPIVTLFVVILVSMIITRVATIMLTYTGLSRESARFQARSAFTGVGFTTGEAERVVNHPVRRRIIMTLMLLGNAGIVTAISTLILTFVNPDEGTSPLLKMLILVGGLAALWSFSMSAWVDRHLSHLIERALRRFTRLDVTDYASLMHLAGEYRIAELEVEPEDWLANRTLAELSLRDEGVVVLGIVRQGGAYLGAPDGDTKLQAGDVLIAYGRTSALEELDRRRAGWSGDREHDEAVVEQEKVEEKEREVDPLREARTESPAG